MREKETWIIRIQPQSFGRAEFPPVHPVSPALTMEQIALSPGGDLPETRAHQSISSRGASFRGLDTRGGRSARSVAELHSKDRGARYTKDGIDEAVVDSSQLRLLVHCPGCPPFIAVIPQIATIAELQTEVLIPLAHSLGLLHLACQY